MSQQKRIYILNCSIFANQTLYKDTAEFGNGYC